MFNISNCCRICLIPNDSNKDVHSFKENGVNFVDKIQVCVPEINWKEHSTLPLCTNCIDKLNKLYEFKKLCLQSHTIYQKLSEICHNGVIDEKFSGKKKIKLDNSGSIAEFSELLTSKTNKTVFSNLCITPSTMLDKTCGKKSSPHFVNTSISIVRSQSSNVDTKKPKLNQKEQENVILESKSEELSVEIDPMDYDLSEEHMYPMKDNHNGEFNKDWDDLIEINEINKFNSIQLTDPLLQDLLNKKLKEIQEDNIPLHSGHFLSSNATVSTFVCDICFKSFESSQILWYHKKHMHNSEQSTMSSRKSMPIDHDNLLENSITLKDFIDKKQPINELDFETEYKCTDCKRHFSSARRLSRHVETYHGSRAPRKYFTKGTKNAKCDICDKEVSTQAYLQIHKKLHYKKGEFEPKAVNTTD